MRSTNLCLAVGRAMTDDVFVPTEAGLECYEARAAAIVRDVGRAPDVFLAALRQPLPDRAEQDSATLRAGFTLDDARQVIACEHGAADWDAFTAHLERLIAGDEQDAFRTAARAVAAGDPQTLARCLQEDAALLDRGRRGTHGHSLLGLACHAATGQRSIPLSPASEGVQACVDRVLANGADLDAPSAYGWTPLHTCAFSGHTALARRLLELGAAPDVTCWETDGATPLAHALFYAHRDTAELLDGAGRAPDNLRTAAALGDLEGIEGFFTAGGSLRPEAGRGRAFYRPLFLFPEWTPSDDGREVLDEALVWSARSGRVESMAALVARGARVDATPYRGTPLVWCVYADHLEAATWLLDAGADPDVVHDFGGAEHGRSATAMHLAAQYSCLRTLALLLERGAATDVADALYHATPLQWAEYAGQTEAAELLRAHGAR